MKIEKPVCTVAMQIEKPVCTMAIQIEKPVCTVAMKIEKPVCTGAIKIDELDFYVSFDATEKTWTVTWKLSDDAEPEAMRNRVTD